MTATQPKNALPEVVITRIFNAPRALVFKAWTDPKELAKWWGPKDWTNPVCELDVRVGGAINVMMRGPAPFGEHPMGGEFREIVPPERLVFISRAFKDEAGNWGLEAHNTVTFEDLGARTKLTVTARIVKASPAVPQGALDGMEMGWSQSLDKLAALYEH